MKHLKSLREYIDVLKEIGEVQEIDQEVDWNLEIGAITRRSYDLKAPAPLFNNIKGIEKGFRVLGAPGGVSRQPGLYLSRIAISLGLDPYASGQEIIEKLAQARLKTLIPPKLVQTGSCKENILLGNQVDLLRFPAPIIHAGDGGRYINTIGTIVAQTPDKKWTNWSIARMMILDKNRMAGIVAPAQHLGKIHAMWKELDKPMPFALALGVEPAIPFVSGMPVPDFVDESGFIGAYLDEALEVVRCETVDLEVPATAEIVIEGLLSHTETAPEGPMGEYAGYIWQGLSSNKPVYHVSAITYRNDPILPVVVAGEPVEEDHTAWGLPAAAEVLHELRQHNLPVTMCYTPLETAVHWLVVTMDMEWREKTNLNADQLIQEIGKIIFKSHVGYGIPKVLVMENDIDPTNTAEVVWAFATRCHPGTGEVHFPMESMLNLPVFLRTDEKKVFMSTKAIYNCLSQDSWTSEHRPRRTSFREGWPKEIQERVLNNWHAYGYQ
ncbi:MAG: UbiD family decarboxylase [Brasilonema angustatum HA4187-MV1]|jgi:4-hydroxy-3-polyprenylbenzoate decarboxylase|nr:UbiD family decarboxylase [Brasilonema angustatum HA4187-MV1]